MEFYETSAKTGKGVEDAFTTVAKKLMVKKQQAIAEKKEKSKQKPGSSNQSEKSKEKEDSSKIALDSLKSTKEPSKDEANCSNC